MWGDKWEQVISLLTQILEQEKQQTILLKAIAGTRPSEVAVKFGQPIKKGE